MLSLISWLNEEVIRKQIMSEQKQDNPTQWSGENRVGLTMIGMRKVSLCLRAKLAKRGASSTPLFFTNTNLIHEGFRIQLRNQG
ncbi:hypothetical protein AVEN_42965-1 [Araneus ventricosus]|uniref:Uncharacterized protein n=1 Tax=Araneus ventricosus TaxID=182803 RepID=A0A4Y2AF52_ARAVE|nr:hypothetical protein AVEN_42965-1 [Araneus ventricosus]